MKTKNSNFDEFQIKNRNKAYRYSLFSFIFYNLFFIILEIVGNIQVTNIFENTSTMLILGIMLSMTIFSIITIKTNSYLELNKNINKYIILFLILGVLSLSTNIILCFMNGFLVDNKIPLSSCGLLLSIIFICLSTMLFIKNKQVDIEEED
jgi:hypothetical protein